MPECWHKRSTGTPGNPVEEETSQKSTQHIRFRPTNMQTNLSLLTHQILFLSSSWPSVPDLYWKETSPESGICLRFISNIFLFGISKSIPLPYHLLSQIDLKVVSSKIKASAECFSGASRGHLFPCFVQLLEAACTARFMVPFSTFKASKVASPNSSLFLFPTSASLITFLLWLWLPCLPFCLISNFGST